MKRNLEFMKRSIIVDTKLRLDPEYNRQACKNSLKTDIYQAVKKRHS